MPAHHFLPDGHGVAAKRPPNLNEFSKRLTDAGGGSAVTSLAGFAAAESVVTPLAGFGGAFLPHPPGGRKPMPAARKYPLARLAANAGGLLNLPQRPA